MQKPERVSGAKHILSALLYSVYGMKRALQETAFRHELFAAAAIMIVFWAVDATLEQFVIAIVLILVTLAVEALNTAIEEIMDHVSPEWSAAAKHGKDLGSFAVMCMLLAMGIYAASVAVPNVLEAFS